MSVISLFLVVWVVAMSLFNAALGVFVLLRNPRNLAHRAFFALTALIALWVPANFFGSVVKQDWLAEWLIKADFALGFGMAAVFFLLANTIGRRLIRRINLANIVILVSLVMAALVYLNQVVQLHLVSNGVEVTGATFGPVYDILILGFILAGFVLLAIKRRQSTGVVRAQVSVILYGVVFMLSLAAAANMIVPKFIDDIEVQNTAQRLAYLGFVFFNVAATYAIIRHRLFDIRLVVAHSVAFLLLLATATSVYSLAAFTVSQMLFSPADLSPSHMAILVLLAVILAWTFHPLRRFFERQTDRFFFRDRYEPQAVLNSIGNILATERLLDRLMEQSLRELCHQLRIAGAHMVVLDQRKLYKEAYYGPESRRPAGNEVIEKLHARMIVADELEPSHLKQLLDDHKVRVTLMLWTQGETVGFLFLGEKLSGEIYSHQDLALLEILRKELAVAVVNARAYQEIATFNTTLQEKVRKATARLRTANEHLKVLDKTKDDFISMASHQLGTPLTAVTGFLTMALDEDRRNMTPDQREYVESALEAGERLQAMAADLLNASQLSADRFFIQPEPVNLGRIVADEIKQLRPAAERKGLNLIYEPPATRMKSLMLDAAKTRHVVMNLIDNAIFYTAKGQITVALTVSETAVQLTVTDTGIGVPRDEQLRLFARFYRAQNAKTARPDGTGLGLYLAKRVIEDQGGSIIFNSVEGQGSTFGFTLPTHRS